MFIYSSQKEHLENLFKYFVVLSSIYQLLLFEINRIYQSAENLKDSDRINLSYQYKSYQHSYQKCSASYVKKLLAHKWIISIHESFPQIVYHWYFFQESAKWIFRENYNKTKTFKSVFIATLFHPEILNEIIIACI